MGKTLVILESPGKVKAVSKYLGDKYEVVASNGHVIDLPAKELGVDVKNDFKPKYIVIEKVGQAAKILKKIESLSKTADKILIATDPDREGEAIGWHIANRIKKINDKIFRVSFNEITKKGVESGVKNEGEINTNLVNAQQARRIMDRLVGYKISPFLWKVVSNGLSAGRVQSVALRIICERDKQINEFIPEEYWSLEGLFSSEKEAGFKTDLVKIKGKDFKITSKEEMDELLMKVKKESYKVHNITKKKVKKTPPAPFITSTLLQASVNKLGFSSKKAMSVAQQLYEGIEIGKDGAQGLITYMRTDSTRISADAIDDVRDFISKKYGTDFIVKKQRVYKSKKSSQDAHEAVRPTNVNYEPKKIASFLTKDQLKLYQLIWTRFVATQMADALYDQTVIDITGDIYNFRISGRVNTYKGFLQAYIDTSIEEEKDEEQKKKMPVNIDVGQTVNIEEMNPAQHFTKPAGRFNEASLTKELEEDEIGRPSTYATIVERLITQKYIEKIEKKLISTELGNLINGLLVGHFPELFNIEFTKKMEADLDSIEFGDNDWIELLGKFYTPFEEVLKETMGKSAEIKKETVQPVGEKCPECDGELLFKWGKNGKFIACGNFPTCKYTRSIEADGENNEPAEKEIVGKCTKCGTGNMVVKIGRYGKFIACDNYPKCKNILPETIDVKCPKDGCEGQIIARKSKRGKKFYGCDQYPKCDFVTWNKPVQKKCPNCDYSIMEEVIDKKTKSLKLICPECKHEIDESQD